MPASKAAEKIAGNAPEERAAICGVLEAFISEIKT
jgi:hypothetical protein